jgi:hypothetical protein
VHQRRLSTAAATALPSRTAKSRQQPKLAVDDQVSPRRGKVIAEMEAEFDHLAGVPERQSRRKTNDHMA